MNFWHLMFHFPDGGVYSNILASILWTTPSFLLGMFVSHRRLKSHINDHMDKLHVHINNHSNELHKRLRAKETT